MNSLYLGLAIAVAVLTICGTVIRAARSIVHVALAARQLAGAVRANTLAIEALTTEVRTRYAETDRRLLRLEPRHGRAHP